MRITKSVAGVYAVYLEWPVVKKVAALFLFNSFLFANLLVAKQEQGYLILVR